MEKLDGYVFAQNNFCDYGLCIVHLYLSALHVASVTFLQAICYFLHLLGACCCQGEVPQEFLPSSKTSSCGEGWTPQGELE